METESPSDERAHREQTLRDFTVLLDDALREGEITPEDYEEAITDFSEWAEFGTEEMLRRQNNRQCWLMPEDNVSTPIWDDTLY